MAPQFKGRLLAFHNEVLEQTSHEYVPNVWRRRHGYRLTIFRCKATTMPWWQSPSSSLDDVTDRGATPRLNFPLSLECDEATLLCREWPVFEVDEVTLPAPFPFPLATSDLTDSERSGISFMESGLSSGVSVFSITFVVDVVDDVFNDVLLALLSRWFGWKDNKFFFYLRSILGEGRKCFCGANLFHNTLFCKMIACIFLQDNVSFIWKNNHYTKELKAEF